jgi:modulator of FtsH protease HflC
MSTKFTSIAVIILLMLIVGYSSLYTVRQGQAAIALRLGKIKENADGQAIIYNPGLHFKIPILESVQKFDVRLQTLDIDSSRIVTAEKKDVIVDYYAKWRIANLPQYYTATSGDQMQAEILLQQQLNDGLRAQFGRRNIREVVSDDRESIMASVRDKASQGAARLGLQVIDVRIKRIDLPPEVSSAVYDRMRAERNRVAAKHRADGRAQAEAINAEADANAAVIIATAKANSQKVRAQGDGKAAKIYADAYGANPEFYAFYRSLTAYAQIFSNKSDLLVLSPDSQFFSYFNEAAGRSSIKDSKQAKSAS